MGWWRDGALLSEERARRARRAARLVALAGVAGLALAACQGPASTLAPRGPRAARDVDLWWLMVALGGGVYLLVLALLFVALVRAADSAPTIAGATLDDTRVIVGGGIVLSLVVLPVLWVVTLRAMRDLDAPPSPPVLTIDVVGHQWWYEVRYPARGVALTNELRVPAGQTVRLRVTSADVIHSFWVPRLMGKIDMIPGVRNQRWLVADQPGRYLVECAEFCGRWHARMRMEVVAVSPSEFQAWLARQPAATPTASGR